MEPKKPTDVQKNLNTVLLAILIGLSTWTLVTVNALEIDNAKLKENVITEHNTNEQLRASINSQGIIIGSMDIRLNTVETMLRNTNK